MAFKKALAYSHLYISKISNHTLTNCRISSSLVRTAIPNAPSKTNIASPDPGDDGIFRRFLHKKPIFQSENRSFVLGESMMQKLKALGIGGERISLDGVIDSTGAKHPTRLTVDDARKVLRAAQLERVKSRLREVDKTWIPYVEFIRMCREVCWDADNVVRLVKTLDESGTVIVLGNMVLLRPEQVAKTMEGLIPAAAGEEDWRRKELEEMERQKGGIDLMAESAVRRELWCGLGFLAVQTMGLMRLTFWELSWDVMEPICFYLTSFYFMGCYGFFLITFKEPSFEGLFQIRFSSHQTRLMKLHNFDVARVTLKKATKLVCAREECNWIEQRQYKQESKPLSLVVAESMTEFHLKLARVFVEHTSLPPSRNHNHAIRL